MKPIGSAALLLVVAGAGCATGPYRSDPRAVAIEPGFAPASYEPPQAGAPITPLKPKGDQWSVAIAPYFWAPSMSGEIDTAVTSETDFFKSFDDVAEDLQLGLMFAIEAREPGNPWGFLVDTIYMELEDELGRGEIEVDQLVLETDFTYRPNMSHEFDFLGGLRMWNLDTEVELNSISTSTDRFWVDPVIGMRETIPTGGKFSIQARADIGGFGIGSDITWQLLGTLRFEITPNATLAAGYRWVYVDYDHNDFEMQVDYYGPLLGLIFTF